MEMDPLFEKLYYIVNTRG